MIISKEVENLILELGKESGQLTESDNRNEFVKDVIRNSSFENTYNKEEAYQVFEKAVNGDLGSLIEIRKAWGLSVF